jgi:hypothetical protein
MDMKLGIFFEGRTDLDGVWEAALEKTTQVEAS